MRSRLFFWRSSCAFASAGLALAGLSAAVPAAAEDYSPGLSLFLPPLPLAFSETGNGGGTPLLLLAQAEDAGAPVVLPAPNPSPPPPAPVINAGPMPNPALPLPTIDRDSPFADLVMQGNAGPSNPAAPPFLIVPRIMLSELLSDNVRHSPSDPVTDLVTMLTLGATASADTPRLQGMFTYNGVLRRGLSDSAGNRFSQTGFLSAHTTLIPDAFYFDLNGNISEIDRTGGAAGNNPDLQTNAETSQTYVLSATPDFKSRVSDIGFVDIMYSGSKVWIERNTRATVINGIPLGPLTGSTHHQARADFRMPGTFAARLMSDISVNGSSQETSRILGIYRQVAGEFINEYQITRSISGIGGVGYESLSNPNYKALQGQGVTFDFGARLRPNADSSILILYGRHDQKSDFSGQINWKFSDTTSLYGAYTDSISTTQQALVANNIGAGLDFDGPIADVGYGENPAIGALDSPYGPDDDTGGFNSRGGFPVGQSNSFLSGQNDIFRKKNLRGTFHTSIEGESFNLTTFYYDRTSLTGQFPPQQITRGVTISWLPIITSNITGNLQAGYRVLNLNHAKIFTAAATVNYSFSETASASLRYDFIRNTTSPSTFGYTANTLTLRLRKSF